MHVFNTLAPVFLLIALGAALRRWGRMPVPMAEWASELTYWVALPALLFHESARARIHFATHFDLFAVLLGGMALCTLTGYAAALVLGLRGGSTSALVQAAFRGNLAFIGIPVAVYSLSGAGEGATAMAVLIAAALIPFYNVLAVLVLLAGQHRFSGRAVGKVCLRVGTNPLILSCAAGLLLAGAGVALPLAASRTVQSLGQMALPLALLSIGGTLDPRRVQGVLGPVVTASLIKVALAPLAGYFLGRAAGLTGEEMRVALILLACPTAAASFVMADQMGGDTHLTAGAIVLSTLLSLASLMVVVGMGI